MKKHLLLGVVLSFTGLCSLNAQSDSFWTKHQDDSTNKMITAKGVSRISFPKEFDLYKVNINSLRQALFTSSKKSIITLPNTQGKLEQFEMVEASNFEPALQARFPQIRAYSGRGITDKYATVKLSISPQGIQTMVFRTDKENEFMEPYSEDRTVYAVFKSHREKGKLAWTCSTDDKALMLNVNEQLPTVNKSSAGELKTLRLAQSCNGEYAAYFGATTAGNADDQTKVLAAFNATLTRCNGVYEKDLALHLNLIDNTTSVIYYNPTTDPYTTTLSQWNAQLMNTLHTTLGDDAFDIGHMFGASGGGGNAGCIGCVCSNTLATGVGTNSATSNYKGSGITSPADAIPEGDNFDIDYVVHEVGHQLGGNHTFSNSNEGRGVSKEVGSGITIMGYAGITGQDLAPHSIDIYHEASIEQIQTNLATKTCPITTSLAGSNATPVVNPVSNYTIPKSTPFVLTGSATDANTDDALTYCWEQNDDGGSSTGAASSASITKVIGPNFLSWSPTASPSRYFPKLSSIIANSATTAQVGGDAGMLSEALSSVARDLNFRLTVRDNSPYTSVAPLKVGQTAFTDMKVTVNAAAGPFVVTSPNQSVIWVPGESKTVTWDVAGTDANSINTAFVDIYLSTDGGNTYPTLLASKVPNDGSETITVPNVDGDTNRIMIKGFEHIFFDISNVNFTISSTPTFFITTTTPTIISPCTATTNIAIDYEVINNLTSATTFNITGLPVGVTFSINPTSISANGTIVLTLDNLLSAPAGIYNIMVNGTNGTITKSIPFKLNIGINNLTLSTPANNATKEYTSLSLKWVANPIATSYDVQVATDPGFTTIIKSGNTVTNSFQVNGLTDLTDYYWRVLAKNATCTGTYSETYKFTTDKFYCASTASTNVPIAIATTAGAIAISTLTIPNGVKISDINVSMNITHTWLNDITTKLKSPSGKEITLFAQKCNPSLRIQNVNATFDDSGIPIVCGTNPGITGVVVPDEALAGFNDENSAGIWTLTVTDAFALDGGSINSWSLAICSTDVPLSTVENSFQDFSLFPNPNNGNFTIKLTSSSSEKINVNVFDIGGREVYQKAYSNNGSFNQNINLDNVQSGTYIISVNDGDKKTFRRIVIE
jgi:subtilisin-like proprotein convertase family protein